VNYWLAALEKYAVFSGRARRSEYWYFVLFNAIFGFGWGVFAAFFGTLGGANHLTIRILVQLFALFTLLPAIAVAVRRLHDTGRSGWWCLLQLVPLVGTIVVLVFLVEDGQPGENRYGPNPKTPFATPFA
jgi:uncharacterized membrane protein YhaH (DUF805 family)